MPFRVILPPEATAQRPLGVSPIPEKAVPAVPTGSDSYPPDPKARLWCVLDEWANLDEAARSREAVDGLKDEILDVFKASPGEAESWFRAWRQAHPEAKLA